MTIRKQFLIGMTALSLGIGAIGVQAAPSASDSHPRHEQMKQRMEQRMTDLHGKLKLNAEQEKAWNSYIAAMKPGQGGERPARPTREAMASLTAPQRMEKMHEMMKLREQKMATRVAATRDFYAVLTPEQRKVFDENFHMGRGHHGKGKQEKS